MKTYTFVRFSDNCFKTCTDELAVEKAIRLEVVYGPLHNRNIHPLTTMMRTPKDDKELALGLLFSLGIIRTIEDVSDITFCERSIFQEGAIEKMTVILSPHVPFLPLDFLENLPRQTSCGTCSSVNLPSLDLKPMSREALVSFQTLGDLPLKMSLRQELFRSTGGVHAAALFTRTGDMLGIFEDVGRHNALDKLIGHLLRQSQVFTESILLLSSRASFEMVQKAAIAKIPVVAVLGAVSSMAITFAEKWGVTLAGFLKKDRCNVYTHAHRIVSSRGIYGS